MNTTIILPKKSKIIKKEGNRAVFEISECHPGYGMTLGNAFRRVLLSSLPGAAVTSVKIKGVSHEFSTIPGIVEDVVQIVLNLKQIRFKLYKEEPVRVFLKAKGEKKVTASDIKLTSDVEVVNKDACIATLTDKKAELDMEIEVDSGLGYVPVEQRKREKLEIGTIAVDAIFTPIRKVNYEVENMRVGERTDYNRLRIDIETDGSITPEEAFEKAAQILVDHFKSFTILEKVSLKEKALIVKKVGVKPEEVEKEDVTRIRVADLKLSSRIVDILHSNNIKTVRGLAKKTEKDLRSLEGMGEKAVKEIKKVLGLLGLTLNK